MPLFVLLLGFLHLTAPPAKATVYVFLAGTCPISQAATLPLRELHGRYAAQGVAFVGVFPSPDTDLAARAAFGQTYQVPFPLLPLHVQLLCQARELVDLFSSVRELLRVRLVRGCSFTVLERLCLLIH